MKEARSTKSKGVEGVLTWVIVAVILVIVGALVIFIFNEKSKSAIDGISEQGDRATNSIGKVLDDLDGSSSKNDSNSKNSDKDNEKQSGICSFNGNKVAGINAPITYEVNYDFNLIPQNSSIKCGVNPEESANCQFSKTSGSCKMSCTFGKANTYKIKTFVDGVSCGTKEVKVVGLEQ